jgi:catalase
MPDPAKPLGFTFVGKPFAETDRNPLRRIAPGVEIALTGDHAGRKAARCGDEEVTVESGGETLQKAVGERPVLTTQHGIPNAEQNSLWIGARGHTAMEDFHFREKLFHFDHERNPEQVIHPRGYRAHG